MSNYVDLKYINILSARLEQFKQKGKNLFNFRCPYCGDSQKDKTKARGYLYAVKNDMFYKCHNCGIGTNMPNFIKDRDQKLYSEYFFEKFKKPAKKQEVDFKSGGRGINQKGVRTDQAVINRLMGSRDSDKGLDQSGKVSKNEINRARRQQAAQLTGSLRNTNICAPPDFERQITAGIFNALHFFAISL